MKTTDSHIYFNETRCIASFYSIGIILHNIALKYLIFSN